MQNMYYFARVKKNEKAQCLKLYYDLVYFGNVLPKSPIWMLLSSWSCMLPGLIYNACQLELAGIFMLENVNKLQHFEARKCKQASTF